MASSLRTWTRAAAGRPAADRPDQRRNQGGYRDPLPPARNADGLPPHLDPRRGGRRAAPGRSNSSLWHGAALGLRIVAAALSLLVLVGSGWAWATYRSFNANIKRVQLSTHSSAAAKNIDGSAQNILIVGNDDRTPRPTPSWPSWGPPGTAAPTTPTP